MPGISTSRRQILNVPVEATVTQDLSSGSLSFTTTIIKPFILNYVTFKSTKETVQTLTISIDSVEGSSFDTEIFKEKTKMVNDITETYNKKLVPATNGKGWLSGNSHFGYSFEREKIRRKLLIYWLKFNYWRTVNKTLES